MKSTTLQHNWSYKEVERKRQPKKIKNRKEPFLYRTLLSLALTKLSTQPAQQNYNLQYTENACRSSMKNPAWNRDSYLNHDVMHKSHHKIKLFVSSHRDRPKLTTLALFVDFLAPKSCHPDSINEHNGLKTMYSFCYCALPSFSSLLCQPPQC